MCGQSQNAEVRCRSAIDLLRVDGFWVQVARVAVLARFVKEISARLRVRL